MKFKLSKSGIISREYGCSHKIEFEIGLKDNIITQIKNNWRWNEDDKNLLSPSNEPEEHLDRMASVLNKYDIHRILCFSYKDITLAERLKEKGEKEKVVDYIYGKDVEQSDYYPELESDEERINRIESIKNNYDLIIVRHYIEHVDAFGKTCRGLIDKLNDDGMMYLEIPNCGKYIQRKNPLFMWEEHKSYYTKDHFIQRINSAGMYIEVMEEHGNGIEPCICTIVRRGKANKDKLQESEEREVKDWVKYTEEYKIRWQNTVTNHKGKVMMVGMTHNTDRFIQITEIGEYITKLLDADQMKVGKILSSQERRIEQQWNNIEEEGLYILGMNDRYHNKLRDELIRLGVKSYNIKSIFE